MLLTVSIGVEVFKSNPTPTDSDSSDSRRGSITAPDSEGSVSFRLRADGVGI